MVELIHPQVEDIQGRRILVVDDDRLNRRILGGILRMSGHELAEATSGEEALETYNVFRPHLVLLDVMMGGLDGFATCRELRSRHGEECAPIVFITAKSESDDIVEGLSAGGVDYLPKPFRPKEVAARIRTHLHNQWLGEQQKKLVEQLSKANADKNRFLGMAAHDLRNPLVSIRGLSEFMLDGTLGPISPDQRDLIDTIRGASQSMLTLVNDLLDVATIEAGELKLSLRQENLIELADKAIQLANIEAARKNTKIVFVSRHAIPLVTMDSARMRQVVDNLLSNAIKYSPPGSAIFFEVTDSSDCVQFAVKDQGPGIPEGERDKLFKDFSRLSVKPTGGEKSTGLGLAICRKIVEAHHGKIAAVNLPGKGCEFRVTLIRT